MTLQIRRPLSHNSGISTPVSTKTDGGQRTLWNLTVPPFLPKEERNVPQLVADRARAIPDSPAIVDGDFILSYRELDILSAHLACHLRSLGVETEVLVGICLERSVSMIVAALGILKAGGACVPLDPSYPPDWLTFMLQDARPRVVLTNARLSECLPEGDWKYLTVDRLGRSKGNDTVEFTPCAPAPEGLAYVIYTSGSTGTPKGVEVTHGSLLNLVRWHQWAFNVVPGIRATHLSSPSFDAAVWEVWPYLTMGASIHLPGDSIRSDPEALRDWLVAQGITISFVPTPMAERLLFLPWPRETALRVLLTGGDTLHHYPPSGLPFNVVNNYGPTESTVVATSGVLAPDDRPSLAPPIGRPISGTQIFILDENLRPAPIGAAGEIYIGGAGLARGYRNHPQLTQQRFVPNPWGVDMSDRLYRTGDLARWLPDGQIEFLGRADDQIKIRGFRIEPNEISSALNSHPSIQTSMAMARPDERGEKSLVAYVVMRPNAHATASALREFLRSKLPDYMLPSAFVRVESFPMTPNGKVDRAALPAPDAFNKLRDAASAAPLTPVENEVAKIVASLLELESVGRDDNFFLLGGHSLLGTQLIMQIRGILGVEMRLESLFDHPTVAGIAAEIDRLTPAVEDLLVEDESSTLPETQVSSGGSAWQ